MALYDNYTLVVSPDNSFIKFDFSSPGNCSTDVLTCLPIKDGNDIKFQLKIRKGWVEASTWEDDLSDLITNDYKVKCTTSCNISGALSGAISDFAVRTEINRQILRSYKNYRIDVNATYEWTSFVFTENGNTHTVAIANLSLSAGVTFLQNYFNTTYPALQVAVQVASSNQIHFLSTDSTFSVTKIVTRHLAGSYVYNDNVVVNNFTYVEYEVTLGYDFATISISSITDQAFSLALINDSGTVVHNCSNCLCPMESDNCYSTLLEYYCNENSLGFNYGQVTAGVYTPKFTNKVRLALYLAYPQYPEESEVYRKSSGVYQKIASRLEEIYEVMTDYMPKEWHKCLAVALAHDHILMKCDLSGFASLKEVILEEKYTVNWLKDRPQVPVSQASFKVKTMPFNNYNSNMI